ncbi:MAG: CoA transferase, partial [Paracoccaceae bacterium]
MQKPEDELLDGGPLSGITVLDFSRVLAGAYCTMVLAALGARGLKGEKFGAGGDTRALPPLFYPGSADFICFNRGQERHVLDVKS